MPDGHDHRFAAWLKSLADPEQPDRAALAHLRRGLGKPPGTAPEMFPLVEPRVADLSLHRANLCYLVASLFGLNHRSDQEGNFGATCRKAHEAARRKRRKDQGESDSGTDSLEQRFVALLNAHPDDLPDHLRHAVALAESEEVGVNWVQLLYDLDHWTHPDRFVQRQWANSYWGGGARDETDEDQQAAS